MGTMVLVCFMTWLLWEVLFIDIASTSYQATYATNLVNASQLMITDTSSIPNSVCILNNIIYFIHSPIVTFSTTFFKK
jgi:hypothetical protein